MAEIVNLRRARKRQERKREETEAAQNRIAFGMSKTERQLIRAERNRARRDLEAHRLVDPDAE